MRHDYTGSTSHMMAKNVKIYPILQQKRQNNMCQFMPNMCNKNYANHANKMNRLTSRDLRCGLNFKKSFVKYGISKFKNSTDGWTGFSPFHCPCMIQRLRDHGAFFRGFDIICRTHGGTMDHGMTMNAQPKPKPEL